jgi:hypothetical protein
LHDLFFVIKTDANVCGFETMQMLFKGFPEECIALKSLKEGAMDTASSSKWSTEWEANALPLVNQASVQTSLTGFVVNTHQPRPYLISNRICRSVDDMCANIVLKKTVFCSGKTDIGAPG